MILNREMWLWATKEVKTKANGRRKRRPKNPRRKNDRKNGTRRTSRHNRYSSETNNPPDPTKGSGGFIYGHRDEGRNHT